VFYIPLGPTVLARRVHVTSVTDDRHTDHALITPVSIPGIVESKAEAFSDAAVNAQ